VYARIKGKVVLKRAFGPANKALGIPNEIDTVFGTGSRPIDYTVAAIYLLDQKGLLRLDDPITLFFKEVPGDKQPITIRHLLTGQSGLPDFFDNDDDWDPDLAWIDRDSAVKRLLAQRLLFPPGKNREHSHGAFGLLAAIIEKAAQKPYYSYIRENFLDPAGMKRTGEYGESRGLQLSDFAAGGGPQIVGLPNIPPNWGPTSWLIKGSGGMYSTLDDLLTFYRFIRSGRVLDVEHSAHFLQSAFNVDGSDRGFELFSAYMPPDTEVFLFLNEPGDREKLRGLFRALGSLVKSTN
jgi:CubicO group peptidase (beta-lactamase class C family)